MQELLKEYAQLQSAYSSGDDFVGTAVFVSVAIILVGLLIGFMSDKLVECICVVIMGITIIGSLTLFYSTDNDKKEEELDSVASQILSNLESKRVEVTLDEKSVTIVECEGSDCYLLTHNEIDFGTYNNSIMLSKKELEKIPSNISFKIEYPVLTDKEYLLFKDANALDLIMASVKVK